MSKKLVIDPQEKGANGHAKYSPSSLESFERCPRFEQDQNETNEAAEAGTRQHLALETGDLTILQDKWEHDRVLGAQLVEQNLIARYPNAEVVKELRVGGIYNHGSSDFNLLDFDAKFALILDWKFGADVVTPVARNIQIWNYVLNLFTMYPEIDLVCGCIYQPKVSEVLQQHDFSRSDIPVLDTRIRKIIESVEDSNKQPTPDGKICVHCNKKAKCPPWQGITVKALNEEYGFTLPPTFMSIVDLPAEHVGNYYKAMQVLEDFAARGKKAALERVDSVKQVTGEYPDGVGVVERKGNLKCVSPYALAQEANQITEQEFFENCITVKASSFAAALNERTGEPADAIIERLLNAEVFERGKDIRYVKVKGTKAKAPEVLKGVS